MLKTEMSTLFKEELGNLTQRIYTDFQAINERVEQNSNVIHYPTGTGTKMAFRYYPEYRMYFVGFGLRHHNAGSACIRDVSLEVCLSYCHDVRSEKWGVWNGMWYRPVIRACCCQKNESGHVTYPGLVHYRFT